MGLRGKGSNPTLNKLIRRKERELLRLPPEEVPVRRGRRRRKCVVCGERFTAVRSDARYCSTRCRMQGFRDRVGGGPYRPA